MESIMLKLVKIVITVLLSLTILITYLAINYRLKVVQVVIITISSLALIVILLTIYHHYKLSKEKDLIVPIGTMVEINKHKIHIYMQRVRNQIN